MTYEGKTAVVAGSNLGLVGVDEDPGVTEGTAAAVTLNNPLLRPAHRLLMDELNGGIRLGLAQDNVSLRVDLIFPCRSLLLGSFQRPLLDPMARDFTDLHLHYRLLEARADHGLLSGLLAGSPGGGPVGSLELAGALRNLGGLLQGLVPCAHRVDGSGIGGRHVRDGLGGGRVVGVQGVFAETRDSGRVAGPGDDPRGPGGRKSRDTAADAVHHAGRDWGPREIEKR